MDTKQLVENARLVWEENGTYKSGNTRLFSDDTKETAEIIIRALDGRCLCCAINILEACKMALKQAPIHFNKGGDPDEEKS